MLKKIAIVGPEASGKSVLAKELAQHYNTSYAEEYSREYLEEVGLGYSRTDLLEIAKGQIRNEDVAIKQANDWVFFDTNLVVIKIWSLYKYQKLDPKITKLHQERVYDLHLLLRPDLIYENDPLRENPSLEERNDLFEMYLHELKVSETPFRIVEGRDEKRLNSALSILESIFI